MKAFVGGASAAAEGLYFARSCTAARCARSAYAVYNGGGGGGRRGLIPGPSLEIRSGKVYSSGTPALAPPREATTVCLSPRRERKHLPPQLPEILTFKTEELGKKSPPLCPPSRTHLASLLGPNRSGSNLTPAFSLSCQTWKNKRQIPSCDGGNFHSCCHSRAGRYHPPVPRPSSAMDEATTALTFGRLTMPSSKGSRGERRKATSYRSTRRHTHT